jgi:hypothetical protein
VGGGEASKRRELGDQRKKTREAAGALLMPEGGFCGIVARNLYCMHTRSFRTFPLHFCICTVRANGGNIHFFSLTSRKFHVHIKKYIYFIAHLKCTFIYISKMCIHVHINECTCRVHKSKFTCFLQQRHVRFTHICGHI